MSAVEARWREPSSRRELRWGTYRLRLIAGLALLYSGAVIVQLTSAYSLIALPSGLLVLVVGWCILPGIGWRRVVGAAVGAFSAMLMLNGAAALVFLVAPLAAWLFIRQRPALSYLVLVIPAFTSYLLAQSFAQYGWGFLILSIGIAAVAGSAWLARALAVISRRAHSISR